MQDLLQNKFFVTGTDTGVGKTVVSTVLALGLDADYWKPIQTGAAQGTDSEFVGRWVDRLRIWPETYVFSEPVSPHLAAESEGRVIEIRSCLNQFFRTQVNPSHRKNMKESLTPAPRPLVVEGAGGVLVPINSTHLMIDLMAALELSAVVVAHIRLGAINHTLLTLEALKKRNIPIAGVITVGDENQGVSQSFSNYSGVKVLGHIPRSDHFSVSWFLKSFEGLSLSK